MSKLKGSDVFGTTEIPTDEYVLLAKTWVQNGSTVQEAALDIKAVDDMLSIMKMHSIIKMQTYTKTGRRRKDAGLSDLLSGRLGQLVDEHN